MRPRAGWERHLINPWLSAYLLLGIAFATASNYEGRSSLVADLIVIVTWPIVLLAVLYKLYTRRES